MSSAITLSVLALGLCAIVFFATRARERARAREANARAAALASDEASRLHAMLVGMLGHDLRSPLSAISLSTDVLQSQLAHDRSACETLARMRSSTRRMTRMIEQMLDLTRVRLGGGLAVDPSPVELGAIARDVIAEIARAAPAHAVELSTTGTLDGKWDPDRLAQVLSSLITNAVHHRERCPVRVAIDGTAPDRIVITVHDAGVIAPALVPVMFEPVRQPGLGLFLARAIVEAHGGTMRVTSRAGEGTTFTVALPREPNAQRAIAPSLGEPRAAS